MSQGAWILQSVVLFFVFKTMSVSETGGLISFGG